MGILGLIVYNMCCGMLRAVGDSRHPLYFLIVSSVINVVLDIVFVAVFNLGIAGVAYATLIAQFVSAILSVRQLMCTNEIYKLELKKVQFHIDTLKRIIKLEKEQR